MGKRALVVLSCALAGACAAVDAPIDAPDGAAVAACADPALVLCPLTPTAHGPLAYVPGRVGQAVSVSTCGVAYAYAAKLATITRGASEGSCSRPAPSRASPRA